MRSAKLVSTMQTTEGNNTGVAQDPPKWGELIRTARENLGESQAQFGARFNVTYVAVSLWETGKRDVPGEVTWWLTNEGRRYAKKRK